MKSIIYVLLSILFLTFPACSEKESTPLSQDPVFIEDVVVIQDEINKVPVVLAGSENKEFIVAYDRRLDGQIREFEAVNGDLPNIMRDEQGNIYTINGLISEGPDKGESLPVLNSGMGYWFAFSAHYPGINIYGQGGGENIEVELDTLDHWSIPTNAVARGAGIDAIPALNEPQFVEYSVRQENPDDGYYVDFEDLVIWVKINGESKVYPHKVLNYHEIVNDYIGGVPIAVTYCPLTGTAKVWRRDKPSDLTTFGVSGLIYNNNLIAFDRSTGSFWPQIEARSVFGYLNGEKAELIPHLEVRWSTLLSWDRSPFIISQSTGFQKDYGKYPYGDYKENERILFPILYDDPRMHPKDRVFCIIIGDRAKVYQFSNFR